MLDQPATWADAAWVTTRRLEGNRLEDEGNLKKRRG